MLTLNLDTCIVLDENQYNTSLTLLRTKKNTTNDRNHAVSTIIQVLFITLIFLASGSFLQVIRDSFLGFDESTVSRVVRRVTQALTTKLVSKDFRPLVQNETTLRKICFDLVVSLVPAYLYAICFTYF